MLTGSMHSSINKKAQDLFVLKKDVVELFDLSFSSEDSKDEDLGNAVIEEINEDVLE